jgi:hypothetical protein
MSLVFRTNSDMADDMWFAQESHDNYVDSNQSGLSNHPYALIVRDSAGN